MPGKYFPYQILICVSRSFCHGLPRYSFSRQFRAPNSEMRHLNEAVLEKQCLNAPKMYEAVA